MYAEPKWKAMKVTFCGWLAELRTFYPQNDAVYPQKDIAILSMQILPFPHSIGYGMCRAKITSYQDISSAIIEFTIFEEDCDQ